MHWRIPPDAPPAVKALADRALLRMQELLALGPSPPHHYDVTTALKVATAIRAEICGSPLQRVVADVGPDLKQLLEDVWCRRRSKS